MKMDKLTKNVIANCIKLGIVPFLGGAPAIGKSSMVADIAENEFGTVCHTLACNQLGDKTDITGARMTPDPDHPGKAFQTFYPHQSIAEANEEALANPDKIVILFMDEINRCPSDVTSACLSLVTERKIGNTKLADNLRLVCAGNLNGNISSLDKASISRFVLFEMEPTANTFMNVVPDLNPYIKSVLQKYPELLTAKAVDIRTSSNIDKDDDSGLSLEDILEDDEKITQITAPRTLKYLSDFLNTQSGSDLLVMQSTPAVVNGIETDVLSEVVIGFIGYTDMAVKILDEIRVSLSQKPQTNMTVKKPGCYAAMKSLTGMQDLQNFIEALPEDDRSAALLYAVYENADNEKYIRLLAEDFDLTKTDKKQFSLMLASSTYDEANLEALQECGTDSICTLINSITG